MLIVDVDDVDFGLIVDFGGKNPLILWSKVLISFVNFNSAGRLFHVC